MWNVASTPTDLEKPMVQDGDAADNKLLDSTSITRLELCGCFKIARGQRMKKMILQTGRIDEDPNTYFAQDDEVVHDQDTAEEGQLEDSTRDSKQLLALDEERVTTDPKTNTRMIDWKDPSIQNTSGSWKSVAATKDIG
ncbi:hypothetical protein Tco_0490219 [Tanacetum coccineum]